ncbi:hypothetical protein MBLNU459_g1182t1 [Dothideomycetes sp. NU459]
MNRRVQSKTKDAPAPLEKVADRKVPNTRTVLWADIPQWQQDNQYITSGYRPPTNSFKRSFASWGYVHNETVNIWSHLLGAITAVTFGIYAYRALHPRYERATTTDILVFSCYFVGATACLGMSATYHTISNHSQRVNKIGNQLDYVGIVALIWGSFVPSIYYGFARNPELIWTYLTMISVIGAGCVTVSVDSRFRTPAWRPSRAGMFIAMGLSAVVPVLHGIKLYGVGQLQRQIGLSWLVSQGVMYIIGAGLYAARVPERFQPGTFDVWGSSHQIFHVLVLMAAATHLVGLLKAFDYEHSTRAELDTVYESLKGLASKSMLSG